MDNYTQLNNTLGKVLTNEPLSKHTTFQVGGPAKYFYIADTPEKLIKAVQTACQLSLPYFILGGGSNVLVSDSGFSGLVVELRTSNFELLTSNTIKVSAGVKLNDLINKALARGLVGLEFLAGIPGTVGGAVRGNAGAWGRSVNEVIKEIEILDAISGELKTITKQAAGFSYRHSRFKQEGNQEIILSVTLELSIGDVEQSRQLINEYLTKRKNTQPLQYPSAGCVFKNIFLKDIEKKVVQQYNLDRIAQGGKVGAGYLIEEAEFKGKQIGGAQVSDQHANFIINKGGATAEDIITLISLIKQKIRQLFNIQLTEEIELVGF